MISDILSRRHHDASIRQSCQRASSTHVKRKHAPASYGGGRRRSVASAASVGRRPAWFVGCAASA
eukprot:3998868-Prymnesium_polylepis.1